jgi:hypothetical protein
METLFPADPSPGGGRLARRRGLRGGDGFWGESVVCVSMRVVSAVSSTLFGGLLKQFTKGLNDVNPGQK